jgi:ABC-type multidrug transport system fused ATPase/permease subunit
MAPGPDADELRSGGADDHALDLTQDRMFGLNTMKGDVHGWVSERIVAAIARAPVPVKLLVIEASAMTAVDYTGSQILQQAIAGLKSRLIDVAITRLSDEGAMAEPE